MLFSLFKDCPVEGAVRCISVSPEAEFQLVGGSYNRQISAQPKEGYS